MPTVRRSAALGKGLRSRRAAPARVDFAARPSLGPWTPPGMTRGRLPRDVHLWFNISHNITSRFSTGARGHFPSLFCSLSRAGKTPGCTRRSGKHPPCSELCFPFPSLKALGPAPKTICRQRREAVLGAARHSPASVLRLGPPSLQLTATPPLRAPHTSCQPTALGQTLPDLPGRAWPRGRMQEHGFPQRRLKKRGVDTRQGAQDETLQAACCNGTWRAFFFIIYWGLQAV